MAKGHVKGIMDGGQTGNSGIMITITDDGNGKDFTFARAYLAELAISVGDLVRFDGYLPQGSKTPVLTYIERIQSGTILSVNADDTTGILQEDESGKQIAFYQPGCSQVGVTKGVHVKYQLVDYFDAQSTSVSGTSSATSGTSSASVSGTSASGVTVTDLALNVRVG